MNKYMQLKNNIQMLIDNGQVSAGNSMAQPNQEMGIFQDPLPWHNSDVHYISTKVTQQVLHNFNPTWSNEFYGFTSTKFEIPFVGNIDIMLDYEFTSSMDPLVLLDYRGS